MAAVDNLVKLYGASRPAAGVGKVLRPAIISGIDIRNGIILRHRGASVEPDPVIDQGIHVYRLGHRTFSVPVPDRVRCTVDLHNRHGMCRQAAVYKRLEHEAIDRGDGGYPVTHGAGKLVAHNGARAVPGEIDPAAINGIFCADRIDQGSQKSRIINPGTGWEHIPPYEPKHHRVRLAVGHGNDKIGRIGNGLKSGERILVIGGFGKTMQTDQQRDRMTLNVGSRNVQDIGAVNSMDECTGNLCAGLGVKADGHDQSGQQGEKVLHDLMVLVKDELMDHSPLIYKKTRIKSIPLPVKGLHNSFKMKIVSWNVNGIRAISKKNFFEDLKSLNPDILCLQETKAQEDQVAETLANLTEYHLVSHSAVRKGYSGTAILSRLGPNKTAYGIGIQDHDQEGRVIALEYRDFFLVNVYVPNSGSELKRLGYRQNWDLAFFKYLKELEKSKPVIVCGDLNVAHKDIDLARPKDNYNKNAGYMQEEINGMDRLTSGGLVDTFRHFYPDTKGIYSWWSYQLGARERNVGWRIDYFLASRSILPGIKNAWIRPDIMGSDHCPVGIEL